MKRLLRGLCALLLMTLLLPTALAAKATPTPPPVAISTEAPVQPPEQIQQVLDIAYNEWAELDGKTLKTSISTPSGAARASASAGAVAISPGA